MTGSHDDENPPTSATARPVWDMRTYGPGTPWQISGGSMTFGAFRHIARWVLPEGMAAPVGGLSLRIGGAELQRLRDHLERALRALLETYTAPSPRRRKVTRRIVFGREYVFDSSQDESADLALYLEMVESSLQAGEPLCFDFLDQPPPFEGGVDDAEK